MQGYFLPAAKDNPFQKLVHLNPKLQKGTLQLRYIVNNLDTNYQ